MNSLFAISVIVIYAKKYIAARMARPVRNPYALCWEV